MNNLRSQPPTLRFYPSSLLFYEWIFVMLNNHGLGNAEKKNIFHNLFCFLANLHHERIYASEIADYHDSSIKIEDAQPHIEQELSERVSEKRKKRFSWLRMKNSRCILIFLSHSLGALCLFILLFSEQQYSLSSPKEPICERLKLLFRVFMERR